VCNITKSHPGAFLLFRAPRFGIIESWAATKSQVKNLVYTGVLEPPQGVGTLGQEGWHIPKRTAERYPSLLSFHGLQGEDNRPKLASILTRPTTWKYYCDHISSNQCAKPDDVAQSPPTYDDDQDHMYYAEGLFTGYFRPTEKNDCVSNPTNCTGHFVDYPCGWRSTSSIVGCILLPAHLRYCTGFLHYLCCTSFLTLSFVLRFLAY
jgi:hypothetical protein